MGGRIERNTHITRNDTVSELSAVLADMEEMKRLHRQGDWDNLLRKYSGVRNSLTRIKASNTELYSGQKEALTGAIQQFHDMERIGERALVGKKIGASPAKLNEIVSTQVDKLNEMLIQIKNQIGR